jgi:hypothetical protein
VAVGRHPAAVAPRTTIPWVGRLDFSMYRWMDDLRATPLTWLFRFLNVVGGGVVTIPLRAVASLFLLWRRWWRRAGAFVLTWVTSEIVLTALKAWFHRGRPAGALVDVAGKSVTTIEGLSVDSKHPVQQAWLAEDVPQCGYCQSGQIMAAVAFLKEHPKPTDADINENLSNICRCGTYVRIRRAIHRAAAMMKT